MNIHPARLIVAVIALYASAVCMPGAATALEVGEKAPSFTLPAADGTQVSLADFADTVVVLEWFNEGCPFVKNHYEDGDMQSLQSAYAEKGVVWLTINSTAKDHQDHLTAEETKELAGEWKIEKAKMLLDESGTVGQQYQAKTTPHMYIINKGTLVYQGAIDDKPDAFSDPKKANNYVRAALDQVLAGRPVTAAETTPYGCSVKYP